MREMASTKTSINAMFLAQPSLVCLLLLITCPKQVKLQTANMCARINEGQLRMRVLTGHVISTHAVNGFDVCASLCAANSVCYSVNYYDRKRKCELNDKTSFNNPEHMITDLEGSYLDIHRPYNDCSDLFCNLEQVCKMDRVDRVYCKACNSPLGMESGKIKDSQITASSVNSERYVHQASSARLNNQLGHWNPMKLNVNEWLQIDFIQEVAVTKVATQGRSLGEYNNEQHWVTSYKLSFSKNAILWEFVTEKAQEKIFTGNTDKGTVVSHTLAPKIRQARFVRFVPMTWHRRINMRVEVYGCEE